MKRKYQMRRIMAGKYIVPSNDQKTVYLIQKYEESNLDDHLNGTYWQGLSMDAETYEKVAQWAVDTLQDPEDFFRHEEWDWVIGTCKTRSDVLAELFPEPKSKSGGGPAIDSLNDLFRI